MILGTTLGAILGRFPSTTQEMVRLLAFTGLLFSKLMRVSHRKGFIDRESYIAQYLALSIFTIGVASSIGADDLLAAFAAGQRVSTSVCHIQSHPF